MMMNEGRLGRSLKEQVLAEPGGEHLMHCFSCGTCMAACLVRRVNTDFNPRRILRMVMLDRREEVLSNPAIWLCSACDACYKRCPQGVHISELMTAIKNVAISEGYEPPWPTAVVDEEMCSRCGICVAACPYGAIEMVPLQDSQNGREVARVNKFLCMNCGTCVAACPPGAIQMEEFNREELIARMQAGGWFIEQEGPKVLVFICNWCLRAEADRALLSASRFPPHVRVVNIPCSGRIDPALIMLALEQGVDGVLVVGCGFGECHYKKGNYIALGKMDLLKGFFDQMNIEDGRVRFAQIGAADRGKFPQLIEKMVADVRALARPGSGEREGRA